MASRHSRDLGLDQIGTTTRFFAIGGLAAGLVLSAAVAKSLPGASRVSAPASSNTSTGNTTSPGDDTNSDDGSSQQPTGGLSNPQQAPQPTFSQPIVSSGGS